MTCNPVRMLSAQKKEGSTTPMKDHFKYRDAKQNSNDEILEIDDDDDLQPQWKALEHRITKRVHKREGRSGRSKRSPSAWDAEHV